MSNSKNHLKIKCRIEGCDRFAMYVGKELCQKHYFRIMRNGHALRIYSTEKEKGIRKKVDSYITPNGYRKVYKPGHPLALKRWVFEHRFIMYEKYGENLPPCELCGRDIRWDNCHIDHKDEVRLNNDPSNLRPLCRPCNTFRNPKLKMHERRGHYAITFNGETKTPTEWSRDNRVKVSGCTIQRRKKMGMSDYDALFSKRRTHNSKD